MKDFGHGASDGGFPGSSSAIQPHNNNRELECKDPFANFVTDGNASVLVTSGYIEFMAMIVIEGAWGCCLCQNIESS